MKECIADCRKPGWSTDCCESSSSVV